MPELATFKTCTGCAACVDVCPVGATDFVLKEDGHHYVSVNADVCIECNACTKVCSVVNGDSYGSNILHSSVYAAWSNDEAIRHSGATSGIFSSIATMFMDSGGYVCGAIMDGTACKYIVTKQKSDLIRLSGSKYMYSNPCGVYKTIRQKLQAGNSVLFCGLPCHCAGLLSFVPKQYHGKLYTIDLICGGVPSSLLVEKFNDSLDVKIKNIISFRDKTYGWKPTGYKYCLKYEDHDSSIHLQDIDKKNLVTDGFACELTNRYSCYSCNYAYFQRKSDLTIGDLWNDKIYRNEHAKGISCVIEHTTKGKLLLDRSNITYNNYSAQDIVTNNPKIVDGKSIKVRFFPRRYLPILFKRLSYKTINRIYAADTGIRNVIWWPYTFLRILVFRADLILRKKRVARIIKKSL